MKNLYVINGGVGKNIIFTALVEELTLRDGGAIHIETAYPDVFIGMTGIQAVYNSNDPKDPKKFYRYFDKVYADEPYNGTFWRGDIHILDAWRISLGLERQQGKIEFPIMNHINIPEQETKRLEELLPPDKYVVIQLSGGQSPYALQDPNQLPQYENNQMRAGRNLANLDTIFKELTERYPDYKVVQFALPNEPKIEGAIQIDAHYMAWTYIFDNCEFFIGIDSMMAHYMASTQKKGMVFWEMNTPEQFGWDYDNLAHGFSTLPNSVFIDADTAKKAFDDMESYKVNASDIKEDTEVITGEIV